MSEAKKEDVVKAPALESKTKSKREEVQKEAVVYIGPSIKGIVSTGTVYSNGLPELLIKKADEQPVLNSLVIPVSKLAEAERELRVPGSALATIYAKVETK